jgi:propanol-preferring alcohol dehydrogenase
MKAMILPEICEIDTGKNNRKYPDIPFKDNPLRMTELPDPEPDTHEIVIKVDVCGACHTELDIIEGRLHPSVLPIVPGHQVVGRVEALGPGSGKHEIGNRVGVAWINRSCGKCKFCKGGNENLCEDFRGTGKDVNGGYTQYMSVHEDYAFPIPDLYTDSQAAPLLCAGVIGYRAIKLTEIKPGEVLGLYGFGASAHIAIQIAKHWECKVFVFSREKKGGHYDLAEKLGADWIGSTTETPPEKLDRAIDFTPVGLPVQHAMRNLEKGGRLVINAIRKVDKIPEMDYTLDLWHEKELKSVANVTRNDALEFLPLAAEIGILPETHEYELQEANNVLKILKQGNINGAAVLKIN